MKAASEQLKIENDTVFYDLELPLHGVYYPLGFTVEIATNSDQVLSAAEESWGHFHKILAEPPMQLRVAAVEGGTSERLPPPTVRAQRKLLVRVADAANFSVSNFELGFAVCWLTPKVVADRGYLRYYFLEGMAWDLLDQLYITPIHAACVRLGDSGVLLCGDSGAGKSSLAYACARKGWMFLSDDSACLIRKSTRPVVVGNPYQIRFRDSAVALFPELQDRKITRRVNGKLSIEMLTADVSGIRTICESSVDYIVFLRRGHPDPPRLTPFPKEAALPWFEQVVSYGAEAVREAQKASLRNLLRTEMFELHYDDLDAAVAKLEEMVGQRAESAAGSRNTPRERTHA